MAPKAKSTERLATTVSDAKADEGIEQMKEDQKIEESAADGAEQFKAVMLDFAAIKARGDGTGKLRGVQQHNERNAVVLAVNHKPIACSESGYSADSWSITPLTIVRVEDPGFCKAPFARGMSKQKMNEAKPLAVVEGADLRLWSFQKASMAKGDRCDDISFTISPGDTFNTFMNATKYKDMRRSPEANEHMLPMEEGNTVIPAYSLLEVTLALKNSDAALGKNSEMNILKVRRMPDDISMHSVAPILTRFPVTLNDALLHSCEKAVKFPFISADLVKDKVSFFREKLNPCMMIENVELGETGPGIAASMDAVSLLITHNPYDARGGGSALRGIPFVNMAKMVANFETSKFGPLQANSKCQVNTGYEYFDGEGVGGQPIYLEVNVTPTYTDANQDLSTPIKDFPLLMPGYSAAKVYECKINLFPNKDAEPPKEQVNGVLVFHLNASKRSASSGLSTAGVKRKLCAMQWST
ncbi:hypothetical protein T484DRAFT_2026206 [Baffinella frigidus]|nr:hypothetical protein T484DRAFT_2026206 [Cryptophyta sp. CCMP2293]